MYNFITGQATIKNPLLVVLDCQGIGYEIHVPMSTSSQLRETATAKLYTYLHVKEDAHTLYGFLAEEDKQLFLLLISVSGIGPATAIGMLSMLTSKEIREAIAAGDNTTIQRVKGVGTKTAQRVVLELKDKVGFETSQDSNNSPLEHLAEKVKIREEAIAALIALGIGKPQAEKSVKSIMDASRITLSVEELIKSALKK